MLFGKLLLRQLFIFGESWLFLIFDNKIPSQFASNLTETSSWLPTEE